MPPIASYAIGQRDFQISVVKVVIGVLMIGFAMIELHPRFEKMTFAEKWLPLGGADSGFFGGLSGKCLLCTSDAADDQQWVGAGGRRLLH